ncbi:MAG: pyridoxine/pyridoxamine 5'-phosphate oxidase, partial [Candidatus Binatia bacterium]
LGASPRAALVFYWSGIRRQVRVEGRVEPVSAAEADAHWATRPRDSRIAASVSLQSAPLRAREDLMKRWRELRSRLRGQEVPRPRWWGGYRLRPESIEFWIHREHRLHDRVLFVRTRRGWARRLLQP